MPAGRKDNKHKKPQYNKRLLRKQRADARAAKFARLSLDEKREQVALNRATYDASGAAKTISWEEVKAKRRSN